jgi:hypothetical protein
MHWDSAGDVFYGIVWGGVCEIPIGGGRFGGSAHPTECANTVAGTIIDAHTGAFIVGGSG